MRSITTLVFIALAVSLGSAVAAAQTFPPEDGWRVLECDGVPSFDPVADEPAAVNERDVVGDAAQPALYIQVDAIDGFNIFIASARVTSLPKISF